MAKRLRIPRLQPDGLGARIVTHEESRPRFGRKPDAERLASEPWRASGYDSVYRRNRQIVIERAHGRCEDCARIVATKSGGTWRCDKGGQVHHKRALSEGGTDEPGNLALLCPSCHGLRDAARRRGED